MAKKAVEDALVQVAVDQLRDKVLAEGATEIIGEIRDGVMHAVSGRMPSSVEFEDVMTIYSTLDGRPSTILIAMLPKVMKKRLPDAPDIPVNMRGKLAFSLTPTVEYKMGALQCLLHPDSPVRDELDSAGLAGMICSKANLASPFHAQRHMQHRHHDEWAMLEDYRERRDNTAREAREAAQLEALLALARGAASA